MGPVPPTTRGDANTANPSTAATFQRPRQESTDDGDTDDDDVPPSPLPGGDGFPARQSQHDRDRNRNDDNPRTVIRHHSPDLPFWFMGLLNNSSYVIMLASAKSISEGGTGLVFLANVVPGLCVKLSAPYWFDKVRYRIRMKVASVLMVCSFLVVAYFAHRRLMQQQQHYHQQQQQQGDEEEEDINFGTCMELLGVALGSVQGSMGEASLLALAGKYDSLSAAAAATVGTNDSTSSSSPSKPAKGTCITFFSSGTGLAGVFGFFFKALFNDWIGLTLTQTLLLANILAISYWYVYRKYLSEEEDVDLMHGGTEGLVVVAEKGREGLDGTQQAGEYLLNDERQRLQQEDMGGGEEAGRRTVSSDTGVTPVEIEPAMNLHHSSSSTSFDEWMDHVDESNFVDVTKEWSRGDREEEKKPIDVTTLSGLERLKLVLSLYPYMIPLFTVYAAEYALQAGCWTAIGFPVDSQKARNSFYEYSNWMYQIGVFVSRSSGTIYTAPLSILWLMPFLQCINVVFFYYVASQHFWYNNTLLIPCFYVGLLGGAVYVNGYTRICADLPVEIREFALSSTSVAESFGIVAADLSGLFLQSCLYKVNGIEGAVVQCPFR